MSGGAIQLATPKDRLDWVRSAIAHQTDKIQRVLPPTLPVERFQQVAINSIRRNPTLLQCDLPSIVDAIIFSADMGLEIGGPTGEAYLVPFWDSKKKCKRATFIPGYRGLIKLALESPNVVGIEAHVVRASDAFEYEYGTDAFLKHKPKGDVSPVVAAYAIADKVAGRPQFHVMGIEALEKIKAEAKRKAGPTWSDRSPWVAHEEEMQRKCPVRNLAKYLDLRGADRLQRALAEEDRNLGTPLTTHPLEGSGRAEDLKARLGGAPPMPAGVDDGDFTDEEMGDGSTVD